MTLRKLKIKMASFPSNLLLFFSVLLCIDVVYFKHIFTLNLLVSCFDEHLDVFFSYMLVLCPSAR